MEHIHGCLNNGERTCITSGDKKKMSDAIKKMFVDLDSIDSDEKPKKAATKKAATKKGGEDKPQEPLLHDSGHNIVEFLSKGKFGYPSTFEYRDMMVRDEEILATAKASTYARTLNSVLKSVMNDPEWYEDMVVSDRDYALMWIWAQNYGSTKDLMVTCSNSECGKTNKHVVDLTKLETVEINEKIKFPYEMELKCGTTVSIHPPTVADEMFSEDWVTKNPTDKFNLVMSARCIHMPMEPQFRAKLEWLRDNVTGAELSKITRYHEFSWFGVNPEISHVCPSCKEVTVGDIPFSANDILWPTVHADIEEFV